MGTAFDAGRTFARWCCNINLDERRGGVFLCENLLTDQSNITRIMVQQRNRRILRGSSASLISHDPDDHKVIKHVHVSLSGHTLSNKFELGSPSTRTKCSRMFDQMFVVVQILSTRWRCPNGKMSGQQTMFDRQTFPSGEGLTTKLYTPPPSHHTSFKSRLLFFKTWFN